MKLFKKLFSFTFALLFVAGAAIGQTAWGGGAPNNVTYDLCERSHFTWDATNKIITGLSDEGKAIADSKRFLTLSIPEGTEAVSEPGAEMGGPFDYCTAKITDEEREIYTWTAKGEPVNRITEIKLPSSLKVLDDNAFYNFVLVTHVDLPEGLQKISKTALGEVCFEEITIPSTVTEMGDCFYGCRRLKKLHFAEGFHMTTLPNSFAAHSESLEEVVIPSGVTEIGDLAFDGCIKLTNVVLSEGLIKIGEKAFSQCDSLKTIRIPSTVTQLGGVFGGPFVSKHFVGPSQTDGDECRFDEIICANKEQYDKFMEGGDGIYLTPEEKAKLTYEGKN